MRKATLKRFFKLFFVLVLPMLVIVLPSAFILMTFERSPAVLSTKIAVVEDAARVRALAKSSLKILFKPNDADSILATEEDLNAVLTFMARGVSKFSGRANITQTGLEAVGTLHLPHNPIGDYMNLHVGLNPSRSGLKFSQVKLGHIKIPGPVALFILRFMLNMALGKGQGTVAVNSVQSVIFEKEKVAFYFNARPELNLERLKFLKARLKGIRDYIAPLGDPLVVRLYYAKLIEIGQRQQGAKSISLARFMGPLFRLAYQRSVDADPADENHATIMALSMFVGNYRFERLIGPVRTEEMKSYRLKTRNVVLHGRQDLRLHFIISAGLKLLADSGISYAVGEFKELMDAADGGSGFSFVDLAADRAGVRFAEVATDRLGGARRLQMLLAGETREDMFFPEVDDLPEGLSQNEFEELYGNVENADYRALLHQIDHRINHLPAYLTPR
ncbi:MAG: hypothetical protein ACE5HI_14015 [bacterium]